MTDIAHTEFAVVDVEGNGWQPPEIVELAIVEILGGNPNEPVSWLLKPPHEISPLVSRIHGIKNADVAAAPSLTDVTAEICEHIRGRWVVAHSATVEASVCSREFGEQWQPLGILDTLRLAKTVWPGIKSYRLDRVLEHAGVSLNNMPAGSRHRAAWDAMATARLFRILCGALNDDLAKVRAAAELAQPQTLF